jgi:hypothetical protein
VHPLDGVWAKIDRARDNLHTLDEATQRFLHRNPYRIVPEPEVQPGHYVIRVQAERTPLALPTIVGDVIHDLRSALDNLVWQLVIANGCDPGRHNQFPIYMKEAQFVDAVGRWKKAKRRAGPLAGVAPHAWAEIYRLQPYRRAKPKFTALATLARLSNIDKHRGLLASAMFPWHVDRRSIVRWNPEAILLAESAPIPIHIRPGPLKHGTELAWFVFDPDGPDPEMDVDADVAIDITFGDDITQSSVSALDAMRVQIATIIRRFERFL